MKIQLGTVIKRLRKQRKMNQESLAVKLNTDKGNISRYENDKQVPEFEKLRLLAAAFNMKISELFALAEAEQLEDINVSDGPNLYRVPLISWVQAGNWRDALQNIESLDNIEWIETTYKSRKHTYALRVVGDSMVPKFPPSSIIIVEPEDVVVNKKFVIAVKQSYNTATFKQFIDDESGIYLKPLNNKYPIIPCCEDTIFCGVVKRMEMDV
ncbi:helix-turn-helix domain-containing protein [Acinetobacter puyangensis]|uniref:helix-turn-helix domain-containing protein n=1 Tax=Acinetobacter puyangensis TaxID=1096779 RepID=UPI003A4DE2A8